MKTPEPHPAPVPSIPPVRLASSLFLTGLFALLFAAVGCVDSSSSSSDLVRNVNVNYTGIYTATGDNLVSQNSGDPIDSLNLVQSGTGLEAFDNNGIIWRGDLSRVNADASSSFRLDGLTTAGNAAQIVGTLDGEDTTGSMTGTYIEEGVFGIVSGTASIAEVTTNAPIASLTISPTGAQTLTVGQTREFSASGGETVSWSVSNASIGRLSSTTGATVNYIASGTGSQTLTATLGTQMESTTITQSGGVNTGF